MRYLILSSLLFIVGCASYPKKQELIIQNATIKTISNPYFSDIEQDYVYKASIDIYDKYFGGLLIIKKIKPENHRVVFTTEMGNKLFDFTITASDFKVNYILDELNKKLLINVLKSDFKALVQESNLVSAYFIKDNSQVFQTAILNNTHYYYVSNQLDRIVRTGRQKEKVHFLFTDIQSNMAKNIRIVHSNIDLTITLKALQ